MMTDDQWTAEEGLLGPPPDAVFTDEPEPDDADQLEDPDEPDDPDD